MKHKTTSPEELLFIKQLLQGIWCLLVSFVLISLLIWVLAGAANFLAQEAPVNLTSRWAGKKLIQFLFVFIWSSYCWLTISCFWQCRND